MLSGLIRLTALLAIITVGIVFLPLLVLILAIYAMGAVFFLLL